MMYILSRWLTVLWSDCQEGVSIKYKNVGGNHERSL